jgi:beta-glucosidase
VLRGQLGFHGLVVSDYFAVQMLAEYHHVAADKSEAARLALEAGIDIELPSTDCYGPPLKAAVASGAITQALVDEVVGRVLEMKFRLGLFDQALVEPEQAGHVFDTPAQRDLAREIACKSIVLLKNAGDILPLRKDINSIAVIGPNADNVRHQMGDYSYPAHIETLLEMMEQPGQLPMSPPDRIELADIGVEMVSVLGGAARQRTGTRHGRWPAASHESHR